MKKPVLMMALIIITSLSGCQGRAIPEPTTLISSNIPEADGSWLIGEIYYSQKPIWGNTLVGLEINAESKDKPSSQSIIVYDLSTRKTKQVIDLPVSRLAEPPSIYENKIVWASVDRKQMEQQPRPQNADLLNWDIFLLDLETNQIQQLTTEEHSQRSPQIYGDTVVWLDTRNQRLDQHPPPLDVYALDLKTNIETRITSNTTVEGYTNLAISGSLVVWTDMRHADAGVITHPSNASDYNNEIYVYDLVTKQERRITNSPLNDHNPDIDGNRVVWLRQEDYTKGDIFLYNLGTDNETPMRSENWATGIPSIYGEQIVWTDARASKGNINNDVILNGQIGGTVFFLYDLQTLNRIQLTTGEEGKVRLSPVIYQDFVVYEWSRGIGPLVYTMYLDYREPKRISVTSARIEHGKEITFSGGSTLPDGTYLQTQLYESFNGAERIPAPWWPSDNYVQVVNHGGGGWHVTVSLYNLDQDFRDTSFTLRVWEKDNPAAWGAFNLLAEEAGLTMLSPEDSSTTSLRPTFKWAAMPDVTEYEFILATDAALTKTVANTPAKVTEASFQVISDLQPDTTYFWAVRKIKPTVGQQSIGTFKTGSN